MASTSSKIIVVGAGAAGLMAALSAAERSASVTLLASAPAPRSHSAAIREGVNAALDLRAEGDTPHAHLVDTLRAGAFLAHQGPVQRMCDAAPGIVSMLARLGVIFDRRPAGNLQALRTIGAAASRAVTAGRATGGRVVAALAGQVARAASFERIRELIGWEFLSLILDDEGACRGVVAQNLTNMEIKAFAADACVLATGGYEALFAGHASSTARDGTAAMRCCRQGAMFANPEFVELHPAAIERGPARIAIPDAAVAHGGLVFAMRDGRPWFFLEEIAPGGARSLTRQQVALAVWKAHAEVAEAEAEGIQLDLTQLDPDWAEQALSPVIDACVGAAGIDPRQAPVEVVPAVGRTLGGLWVDDRHATSIPGLFAAGSCACQYHGAGVLGGNELLAALYGGSKAGEAAADSAPREVPASLLAQASQREEDLVAHLSAQEGEENAHRIARELGELLFASVAVEREDRRLAAAAEEIAKLSARAERVKLADRAEWSNAELPALRTLSLRLELAGIVVAAAAAREESRGGHVRAQHPERHDGKWLATTRVIWREDGLALDHSERIRCDLVKPEA